MVPTTEIVAAVATIVGVEPPLSDEQIAEITAAAIAVQTKVVELHG
jgi:hypothetical protein